MTAISHTDCAEIVPLKILFIINPGSGNKSIDWCDEIDGFFSSLSFHVEKLVLTDSLSIDLIKQKIADFHPDRVIATGGDGTVKLVAECLLNSQILLGIIPAGSANGLAKELGIPAAPKDALRATLSEKVQTIHLVQVNDHLCIHLSDIGFNAYVVKKSGAYLHRGMWAYVKAAWNVLWEHSIMEVKIKTHDTFIKRSAAMVVIANATKYGSGALINPQGRLDDDLFEVVVVKKISFAEIFKMMVTNKPYNKEKTELFQTSSLEIHSRKKVHFQVDGEYLGKIKNIKALLLPFSLKIIIPGR